MLVIVLAALLSALPATTTEPVDVPASTNAAAPATSENLFLPDDTTANITDCISSLPRPECGSKERGGWRQGLVFGVIVVGLIAIGTRLVIGIRRRDATEQTSQR